MKFKQIENLKTFKNNFLHVILATNTSSNCDTQNGVNGNHHHHHQIVLLANEKLELSDNEQQQKIQHESKTSNGANDEELTSLNWLHDKNLLKGIREIKLLIQYFLIFLL